MLTLVPQELGESEAIFCQCNFVLFLKLVSLDNGIYKRT